MHDYRALLRIVTLSVVASVAGGVAFGASSSIVVAPDLTAVFDLLVAAYPGVGPEGVEADGDLELVAGDVDWYDTSSVAVLPDVVLTRRTDREGARAFQRFATSPTAQRALIEAGLLPDSVTVTDQAGNTITVAQPVEGVATPYALTTYLVYGVGAGDRVVLANYLGARDPAGAAAMTRIDPSFEQLGTIAPQETTNVEVIARIAPSVVLAAAGSEWIGSVESLGIPVVAFDGESNDRLREAVRIVGALLGPDASARAEAWVHYFDDTLDRIAMDTADLEPAPRVLFTGSQGTMVASGDMFQTQLIESAGGVSVSAGLRGYWNDVDVEQTLVWNPDVILVPPYGGASVQAIVDDPEWRLLPAVREGAVVRMPKLVAPWDTPVPDAVLGIVWLAEVLHPDIDTVSCTTETDFFYRRFYGYEISEEEVADLCAP